MEDVSRQNIQSEFFDKTFGLDVLPPTGSDMVMLTVLDKIVALYILSKATRALVPIAACTELLVGQNVNDE